MACNCSCKFQGAILSSQYGNKMELIDNKKQLAKARSSVKVEAVLTNPEMLRSPGLDTRHVPPITPFIDHQDQRPVFNSGKFGRFGGTFVPETLIACFKHLEAEFNKAINDRTFKREVAEALRDFVGRETPLYHARRLSEHYRSMNGGKGADVYLKREDLNHGGSHKMNNALAQSMLAKRMGCKRVVTATASGQHGIATAAASARVGLECTVLMAEKEMQREGSNVKVMKLLGAEVEGVKGGFKEASSEAFRRWVGEIETSYHLTGSAVGPHPCPQMVREFQSVIGKETRLQALERWGGKPDVVVACVGTGSNAMGLFHEFLPDTDVRLIGVEAAGHGLHTPNHSSTLAAGHVGVYHGSITYLLQDEDAQIPTPHSIAPGMECPGVSPELSFLKDSGRAEFHVATDQEAIDAYKRLCKLEGIFPSLEAAHALAILDKLIPTLCDGSKVVVNCSGRGDKDAATVFEHKLFNGDYC